MLPNLIIIGAAKAGTTSLHYYLDQHPEVEMSTPKEPHFFGRENWHDQLEWYESLFPGPAPVRGEASPSYTTYPVKRDVPRRIRELIPDAKLIYLVRDPVERLPAHYGQQVTRGKETRSFEQALTDSLRDGDDPANPYLAGSSYATQMEQYLQHFPPEQLMVIDLAELSGDRPATLRAVFGFLGVDPDFTSPRFNEVLQTKADQRRFNRVGTWLKDSRLRHAIRARVPRRLRRAVGVPIAQLLSEPVERPAPSPELTGALRDRLRPEAERLRELTGKPFSGWSV